MAITLRGEKGSSLTHDELDNNFREFFYSSSVEGSSVVLHRYTAISSSISFPVDPPVGLDGYIQLKKGNAVSGSDAVHTGSANLKFDYNNNHLRVTGSYSHRGSVNISQNLVVGGTVTAEEFITEKVATSYIYKSGSTKFGDDVNDNHAFTGSLEVDGRLYLSGPFTQSGNQLFTGNTSQTGNITLTGHVTQSGNQLITGNLTQTGEINLTGDYTQSGNLSIAGDTSQTGDVTLTGNEEITGSIEVTGPGNKIRFYYNDTSSLPSATTYHGMFAHTHTEGKAWFSHAGDWVELATSESVAESYLKNTTDTLTGDLTVTGKITAQEFHTEFVSASITYESGSHKFGDTADDKHEFTGSVNIKGDTFIDGTLTATSINATFTGSIDNAVTASHALTVAPNSVELGVHTTGSYMQDVTGGTGIDISHTLGEASTATISVDVSDFMSNGANNRVVTATGTDAQNAEANLTFDGSTLNITGGISATGVISGSNINASGDITAYYSSDERLKDNVTPLSNAINKVNQIGGYEFDWNSNSEHSGHDVGVIAQEIEKVLPELVVTRDNGYKAVRYEKIVALLIQAIKEQQSQIDELKSKL